MWEYDRITDEFLEGDKVLITAFISNANGEQISYHLEDTSTGKIIKDDIIVPNLYYDYPLNVEFNDGLPTGIYKIVYQSDTHSKVLRSKEIKVRKSDFSSN